jgi:hypothetical protein
MLKKYLRQFCTIINLDFMRHSFLHGSFFIYWVWTVEEGTGLMQSKKHGNG